MKTKEEGLKKVIISGMLIAIAVACSGLYIPFGAAKCFPVQHAVDMVAGMLLGPWYAVGVAFASSLLRVCMGTGTLLAFPGSMIGALLCGILFCKTKNLFAGFLGEITGTGVLGALAAYPIAAFVLSKDAALFGYVLPFMVSSIGGGIIGVMFVLALKKAKIFGLKWNGSK